MYILHNSSSYYCALLKCGPSYNTCIYMYIYTVKVTCGCMHVAVSPFSRGGDKVQGCILWGAVECEWCSRAEQSGWGGGRATGGSCSHSQQPLTSPHLCCWQTPWLVVMVPSVCVTKTKLEICISIPVIYTCVYINMYMYIFKMSKYQFRHIRSINTSLIKVTH